MPNPHPLTYFKASIPKRATFDLIGIIRIRIIIAIILKRHQDNLSCLLEHIIRIIGIINIATQLDSIEIDSANNCNCDDGNDSQKTSVVFWWAVMVVYHDVRDVCTNYKYCTGGLSTDALSDFSAEIADSILWIGRDDFFKTFRTRNHVHVLSRDTHWST